MAKKKQKKDGRSTRWARMTEEEKEEFRNVMRKVMRKKFKDPVYREMMRKSKQTPEFRQLRSEIMVANFADPEFRKKMRENNYDNLEVQEGLSKKCLETWSSKPEEEIEEFRKMRSEKQIAWISDPKNWVTMYLANWGNDAVSTQRVKTFHSSWDKKSEQDIIDFAKAVVAGGLKGPNNPERWLIEFFNRYGFDYRYAGAGGVWIAGYRPDFVHPEYNLIIEFDGNYWHRTPECQEKDKRRNLAYVNRGYRPLILRDNDLKNEERLLCGIRKFEAKYKTSARRRPHHQPVMGESIV